jgi:beta-glucosidase
MGDASAVHISGPVPEKTINVESVLQQLSITEKVALTAGKDFWHTTPVSRLAIPSIRLSDGPNGVRGTRFFDSIPSSCLPCGTALGASFDKALVRRLGQLLGDEAKAKGAHVLLGPTINIQRSPLGGRGFESYSEDPLLSGILAGEYCKGVQDRKIVPTLKHFVCNDQEHERMAYNAIVTDRALREIYLLPFQIAIRMADPGAVMTAYNKVNGTHASESQDLLQNVLRGEWGWNGLVMSDWFGTYGSSEAIKAGLDLEMPGPTRFRGAALAHAISSKKVKITELDSCVRNVLNLINKTRASEIPENAPETELDRDEDRALMRRAAAESIVMLKNDDDILPLKKEKSILVIGPNAKVASYCGGGSASLNPYAAVSPFEGIKAQAAANAAFSQGAYGHRLLPELGARLTTSAGRSGFSLRVYNEPPTSSQRRMLEERHLTNANMFFVDYSHPQLNEIWYADAEGTFTPEESGVYEFGLAVQGTARLYVDGQLVVSNVENQKPGTTFLGSGTIEEKGSIRLEKARECKVLIQWGCAKTSTLKAGSVIDFGHGGLRFGGCLRLSREQAIEDAARLAKDAEQVVVFAGLTGEWESEGFDRETMALPPATDELISRVLEANSNTVVVVQSGTPVSMPWIEKTKAVLHAWFGGNETGNGLADVIYGKTNPSGKLPLTIPRRVNDNPAFLNYRSDAGRTLYGEDIYVGYRWYDKVDIDPLFAFGHGLSYTTFELKDFRIAGAGAERTMRARLTNTGSKAGAEVVQVYVAPPVPSETANKISRPIKELKAFTKVYLEAQQGQDIEIPMDVVRATSFWDEERGSWCSERGVYKVLFGTSSRCDFLEETLEVTETTWWRGL